MNFEEHAAKPLLAAAGIDVPRGELADTAEQVREIAERFGAVVVKAQVPSGKRGKAGAIRVASDADAAHDGAADILGMTLATYCVDTVLVEEQILIDRELYAAVLNDASGKSPLVLFSMHGGMDIEDVAARHPEEIASHCVDIRKGFAIDEAKTMLAPLPLGGLAPQLAEVLCALYRVYVDNDAELVEINPLAVTPDQRLVALDCKFVLDDSSIKRRGELAANGSPEQLSDFERKGRELGLKYIELDGDIGVLANGAGLTMTTMDVIAHNGGRPANFLEIGGEAYTLAQPALELVLANPRVRSLVINFCGAFARTDVMVDGVTKAWRELEPVVPVFFSVHGTGEDEAVAMLRERLDIEPYQTMDDAVRAAIRAAEDAG